MTPTKGGRLENYEKLSYNIIKDKKENDTSAAVEAYTEEMIMKLKTLLEYLDPLTDIVIWSNFEAGTPEYSEEPEFKGCVMDCP